MIGNGQSCLHKAGKTCLSLWLLAFALTSNHLLQADQIVFTEIMYHPQDEDASAWVEFSNLTSTPMDCAQWEFKGRDISFTFPEFDRHQPRESFIRPFEQFILTETDPETFRQAHGIPPDTRIWGPWTGTISTKKEHLKLSDKNGIVLCEIEFDNDPPWPIEAAGAGYSMVVRHPDRTINDWRNWKASHHPGGTPGTIPFPEGGIYIQIPPEDDTLTKIEILPMDTLWRYHPGNADLSEDWPSISYDDSHWQNGRALLGFEEAQLPSPGLQTNLPDGPMTYCFRTHFEIKNLETITHLELDQVVVDGVLYYLNGVPVGTTRFSGAGGVEGFDTPSLETVDNATLEESVLKIDPKFLFEGANILAAEVHQTNANSTDLVFGAELVSVHHKEPLPVRLMEVGIHTNGQGYAKVSNTSDEPVSLSDYLILADNQVTPAPFIAAHAVEQTFPPGATQTIAFNQSITPSTLIEWTRKQDSIPRSPLPLALPGKGYRQQLVDSAQGIWKVERIPYPSQDGNRLAKKGNLMINEISRKIPNTLEIELFNTTGQTFQLDELALALSANFQNASPIEGSLSPAGFATFKIPLNDPDEQTFRIFLFHQNTRDVIDAQKQNVPQNSSMQRFPDGEKHWFATSSNTLDKPNSIHRSRDVVINEIMYDPPYGQPDLEFIELFNRADQAIDLSGWQLSGGIAYHFPDGIIMSPKSFLVIADQPDTLNDIHPHLNALGPLKGKLSNDGELIMLLDAQGNLADEIDFKTEGDWPTLARGKGSSMELLNPDLDNAHSSAWKDSRESRTSDWQTFAFTKPYFAHQDFWHAMDNQELHLYLVGESHVILQNIQFREKGSTRNLLKHSDRLSIEGDSSTGWLIQGNHADSFVENGRLHLISHGHGDNRANRAEIDITELNRNTEYELSFEARWVHGSPRLIARTWENSFSESVLLPVPSQIGTPGKQNSRWQPDPPALLETLKQFPAVPSPGEPLLVQAEVGWHEQLGTVNLVHRLDGSHDDIWSRTPMSPVESQSDTHAPLRTYQVELKNDYRQGELIQYYIEAVPPRGPRTTLPRGAAAEPALCVFDGRPIPSDLRVVRLLISKDHLNGIYNDHTQAYGYRYPRLSNQYFNATFISNERDIYTGAVLRPSGSPWTRRNSMDRGKWKLPNDRRFRDHGKFTYDNDPTRNGGQFRHHNRIARYLLYLLGHVSGQNEFIYIILNAGGIHVREEVEPVDSDFLNRNFKDGNRGELYRVDDDWWMSDHWSQQPRDASWNNFGPDHPAHYRHSWMKRSREEDDDYTAFIDFIQLINRPDYTQEELEVVMDSEAMLKLTAVLGFIADWDTFTQSRGKNAYFYRRPHDQRFQFLQWDADLSFGSRRYSGFYKRQGQFGNWVSQPYNFPRFTQFLDQLVDYTSGPDSRMNAWMFEESQTNHPDTRIKSPFYQSFFQSRASDVKRLKQSR